MRDGFTLIEVMVVVAITAFLAGLLLTYNRSSDNQIVLAAEQARVAGVLFRAKAFSLQKNIMKGTAAACGFGVRFEKTGGRLVLFEDLPVNGDDCGTKTNEYEVGEEIEEIILNPRVTLLEYEGNSAAFPLDILFGAPYLETYNPGMITLELTATRETRSVVIGAGGSISAQ